MAQLVTCPPSAAGPQLLALPDEALLGILTHVATAAIVDEEAEQWSTDLLHIMQVLESLHACVRNRDVVCTCHEL